MQQVSNKLLHAYVYTRVWTANYTTAVVINSSVLLNNDNTPTPAHRYLVYALSCIIMLPLSASGENTEGSGVYVTIKKANHLRQYPECCFLQQDPGQNAYPHPGMNLWAYRHCFRRDRC